MKKKISLVLLLAFIVIRASADAILINGVYYDLVGTTARVTKNPNYYKGTVWIPPYIEYGGYKFEVTSINEYAFYMCSHLTEITIPSTITSIGKSSFFHCVALKAVHISDIDAWLNIDFSLEGDPRENNPLYYAKHLFLNGKEITSLTISNNITCLKGVVFCGCSGLNSVTIPNSVTSIGLGAFWNCGLTSINIPNSVTSIGARAFFGCTVLTSIDIPNSVTSIGDETFACCFGLTSVTIPSSVTSIGSFAFEGCIGLTSITIPNNVTSIGDFAFYKCSGLTSATIGNSVTSIGDNAFSYCSGLTSVTIPNSVTSIGNGAFEYCSGLTSVTIPNSVTRIGDHAFIRCSGLTSVTIPNSVTSIGDYAFSGCISLTSLIIGDGMKELNSNAFRDCLHITDIYCYAETVPIIGVGVFDCHDAIVHVPSKSIDMYKNAYGWNLFNSIVALTDRDPKPTGIIDIRFDAKDEGRYYDLQGRSMKELSKGIYILNGKKVLVKKD